MKAHYWMVKEMDTVVFIMQMEGFMLVSGFKGICLEKVLCIIQVDS
jgi:hypothetical protein